MGIGQVLTMPIFFASNAIYPIALMPHWLQAIASANPLTYEVDGLRAVMLAGGKSVYGVGNDLTAVALATVVMIAIATRMYPRMTRLAQAGPEAVRSRQLAQPSLRGLRQLRNVQMAALVHDLRIGW